MPTHTTGQDRQAPLYRPKTEDAAYQLRYSWTGWPSDESFALQPVNLIEETKRIWEQDGLRFWNSAGRTS